MFTYILMMTMVTAFALLEMMHPDSERLKRWLINVSGFTMAILMGLRFEVGGDWENYLNYHIVAAQQTFSEYAWVNDLGYTAVEWPLAQLGLGVWSINLVCASLLVTGICLLASTLRYRNLFFLSAMPYLLIVVGMGYTRQSAAIGLVCIAIYFSFKERRKLSLFFAILSLFYHKSAAIGIAPLLLVYSKKKWKAILLITISSPVLIILILLQELERVQQQFFEISLSSAGAFIRVIQIFLCGIWYLVFLRKRELEGRRSLLTTLSVFSILFMIGLAITPSTTVIDRLALYLLPFQCYVLAKMPEGFLKGGNRTLAYIAAITINLAIFGVWMTTADQLDYWIPYQNYLWRR